MVDWITHDIILDANTPYQYPSIGGYRTLDVETTLDAGGVNGTYDIVNLYVTPDYIGSYSSISSQLNVNLNDLDKLNIIIDPAFGSPPSYSISYAYKGKAFIRIDWPGAAGNPARSMYIEINAGNAGDYNNGVYYGQLTVTSGSPPCFVQGTAIKTVSGEVMVEHLKVGDLVVTADHGLQPVRWVGSSRRQAVGTLAPVLIKKHALGNDRDLLVSQQHRMFMKSREANIYLGESEVLATAKSLINGSSISLQEGGFVTYYHVLFDNHELIWGNGALSESFHPGAEIWKSLDLATRNEILEIFPQLENEKFLGYGQSARMSLKHHEGELLGRLLLAS